MSARCFAGQTHTSFWSELDASRFPVRSALLFSGEGARNAGSRRFVFASLRHTVRDFRVLCRGIENTAHVRVFSFFGALRAKNFMANRTLTVLRLLNPLARSQSQAQGERLPRMLKGHCEPSRWKPNHLTNRRLQQRGFRKGPLQLLLPER
jgi:hypothetical protein